MISKNHGMGYVRSICITFGLTSQVVFSMCESKLMGKKTKKAMNTAMCVCASQSKQWS